ncbi:GNAT family N-acetyltransferase [Rhodoligotrophos ferricapiens]|uniref:GNAT family N-acetyltransferase n=1 Tax=Rhodoligotrophos ferricapiens TaxID=3069264 RepID=UPI00315CA665
MISAARADNLKVLSRSAADRHALDHPATSSSRPAVVADLPLSSGSWKLGAYRDFDSIEAQWRCLEQRAVGYPFQEFDWLKNWHQQIGRPSGAEPFILTVADASGRLSMILPLVIERALGQNRLAPMGDPVCDYHGPLITPAFAALLDRRAIHLLLERAVKLAGVNYVLLTRIPPQLGAIANPFANLDLHPFSASAHATSLGDDWESFYASRRSTKTRRRFREKEKALAKLGPIRFDIVTDPAERKALAAEMMTLKASQLQATAGEYNTFAHPFVQNFFRKVAGDSAVADVFMFKLTVGETLAAAAVGLVKDGSFFYEVPVYPDCGLQRYSPGNLLLHKIMAWAIDRGCTRFDFTIGDEPYKLDWCEQTWHLGCGAWGNGLAGRVGAQMALGEIALKRHVKHNPRLLAAAVRLRNVWGRLRSPRHAS